jgi:hypothetical protein
MDGFGMAVAARAAQDILDQLGSTSSCVNRPRLQRSNLTSYCGRYGFFKSLRIFTVCSYLQVVYVLRRFYVTTGCQCLDGKFWIRNPVKLAALRSRSIFFTASSVSVVPSHLLSVFYDHDAALIVLIILIDK